LPYLAPPCLALPYLSSPHHGKPVATISDDDGNLALPFLAGPHHTSPDLT
jgi:hypothetical protein